MSVKRLASGRWQADYYERDEFGNIDPSDRPKQSFNTKKEAKDWEHNQKQLRDAKAKKNEKEYNAPPEFRKITDIVAHYKKQVEYKECRAGTLKQYDRLIRQFLKFFSDRNIIYAQELNPDTVNDYKTWVHSIAKDKGRVHHIAMAKMLFDFDLMRHKPAFTKNPFDQLKLKKITRKDVRFFTDEELEALFEHGTELQCHTFGLILEVGLRNGEACNLPIFRATEKNVIIDDYKGWKPKAFKSYRKIPISDQARIHIDYFVELNNGKDYLLTTETGKKPSDSRLLKRYRYMQARAMRKTDLKFENTSVHSFRYTFGAHLFRAGVPIGHIADLMGHESIATTERLYVGLIEEDRDAAIKKGEAWKEGRKFYKSTSQRGIKGTGGNE